MGRRSAQLYLAEHPQTGNFFAFAANAAYMLGPLKADRDEINTRFKANMFYYLHSKGQHSYSGPEVNFQRPTGEKVQQITFIPVGLSTLQSVKDANRILGEPHTV
jgi:hypothetical protein